MSSFSRARLRRALLAGLAAPLLALSACGTGANVVEFKPGETQRSQYKITGKVTYKGEPVPYGYVLFYAQGSVDGKSGQFGSPSFGMINEDGSYEVTGAVTGINFVAIATDPDVDMNTLMTPTQFGGGPTPPGLGGGPPGGGGGPPGGGPPGAEGPPGGGPPGGGPPGGGPPGGFPGGGPPMPPGGLPGGGPPGMPKSFPKSPMAEKLTDAQKKTLKDMHEQYAAVGKSAILFRVTGEGDDKFDIELPLKGTTTK